MPEQKIKSTLAELREELATVDNLDPTLKDLLEAVDTDIQELLDAEEQEPDLIDQLMDRVDALGARFAADHPATERFFQELVATLGRLGI